jgi:hypothetical protein
LHGFHSIAFAAQMEVILKIHQESKEVDAEKRTEQAYFYHLVTHENGFVA